MLDRDTQQRIQTAYSEYLNSRGLKARPGQKQMIAEVARAIAHSADPLLAIEAGTGTGKTVAYLLPAIAIALAKGKKLVISTATVALQEQLINKDIPEIVECTPLDFQFALVKGRGRYLCQLKLENLLGSATDSEDSQVSMYENLSSALELDALKTYRAMDLALVEGRWDGDREHWSDSVAEKHWRPLTSDRYSCVGRGCHAIRQCAFFNARESIDDADLLVTNHDVVLSDLRLGGGAILPPPEECIFIFDEGHHLADKTRKHFTNQFRLRTSQQLLDTQQGSLSGLSQDLANVDGAQSLANQIGAHLIELEGALASLRDWYDSAGLSLENSDGTIRFPNHFVPDGLSDVAQQLRNSYRRLAHNFHSLGEAIGREIETVDGANRVLEQWYPEVGLWTQRCEASAQLWDNYAVDPLLPDNEPKPSARELPVCRWMRVHDRADDIELNCAPILAGDLLREHLWQVCHAAVVTSATLTALGSFDRFKLHSGFPAESRIVSISSPFDFAGSAQLNIPAGGCDPRDTERHDQLISNYINNLDDNDRAVLVLFSSARQMNAVFENLPASIQEFSFRQGDLSKQAMLDRHRSRIERGDKSFLFGLASFAEGIDLPGEYCTHVVIAKIPFSVPDQPVEAALSEWIEEQGGNAFAQVSLPDASMRLIQAAGRLLRSEQDSGQVSILDQRLLGTGYGKRLLAALPTFRLQKITV